MATKQNSSGLPPAATDGEGVESMQGTDLGPGMPASGSTAGKPAREAPPPSATRNADGTLRTIRSRVDRAEVAEAHFREALVEVPAMMRRYGNTGPDPGKLVAFTLGQHRAVRLAICQLWAESRTYGHEAETRRRDAAAQDDATQALLTELEGRIAALEAKVAEMGGHDAA